MNVVVYSILNTFGRLQNSGSSFLYPEKKLQRRFQFQEVKEESLYSQLQKIKTSKAVGTDELPARLLRDSAGVVKKPLTTLINYHYFLNQKSDHRNRRRVNYLAVTGSAFV